MNKSIKVLLVDDDEDDFMLTKNLLFEIPDQKFSIDWASSFDSGLKEIERKHHDIYLIDYRLGKKTGVDLLNKAAKIVHKKPIIMLTGKEDQKIDLDAMKSGAADYLIKDKIDSFILERSIRYAIEHAKGLEAIKKSETKYRNIFEKSRDIIYITDKEGKFIDFNDSTIKLLGYEREELLQINVLQLYENDQQRSAFEKAVEEGEVTDFEVTLITKTGEKVYCFLSLSMQPGEDGSFVQYQGIIHDITKRKKAEQELFNSEKLAITGRIARTVAHEVRNPLTNVNLALEQLKNEYTMSNADMSGLNIYFDIIKRNSERINQLITELLNSTKVVELQYAKYPVNQLLDESLELVKDRTMLKGIKVEKHYFANISSTISIDAEKVKLAILNILINAIDAMKEKEGVLKVKSETKNNQCLITITDNGSGIKSEDMNKLFEPFYSNNPMGIGLGLTTTQNIITNHSGSIEVESEVGKGTAFTISFKYTD